MRSHSARLSLSRSNSALAAKRFSGLVVIAVFAAAFAARGELALSAPPSAVKAAPDKALTASEILTKLRPAHPRVIATPERLAAVRQRRNNDPAFAAELQTLIERAEEKLAAPLSERKLAGKRLLSVSREALRRVSLWSLAFQLTDDKRFAQRAEEELLAIAAFTDWHPNHFLDTAEMAAAVAIGYDWLYEELSETTRNELQQALVDKALRHVLSDPWWVSTEHNWCQVCLGGLTMAALAIAEDEPALAAEVLTRARDHMPRALAQYGPDGVYPEGPSYWVYGTSYQVLAIDALRTGWGDDFGLAESPGFLASDRFFDQAQGPTGLLFNFSDCLEKTGQPALRVWMSRQQGSLDTPLDRALSHDSDFDAFTPFWCVSASPQPKTSTRQTLPRSWRGRGVQPVVMFRTAWNNPRAMYLAAKGGKAGINHGHMDAGSFIFEANGVRWASDLGMIAYHRLEAQGVKLFDRKPDGDRWKISPYRNESHNTLTISDKPFEIQENAAITSFDPLDTDQTPDRGSATIDLSGPLSAVAESAERRFDFDASASVVTIHDELTGILPGAPVVWTLVTRTHAAVIEGSTVATLTAGKETLTITAESLAAGSWTAEPHRPRPGQYGPPFEGVTLLRWTTSAREDGRASITVRLSPEKRFPALPTGIEEVELGRSLDDQPILARVWSHPEPTGARPETIFMLASIHGSEPAGTPLMQRFEEWLVEQDDPRLPRQIVMTPIANPDGYAAGERFNRNGVDLNRNFPAGNRTEATRHGERPLSEPESAALLRALRRYPPTRVLSIHQPLECIDYDGPGQAIATAMSRAIGGRLPVEKLGGRPGSLGSYVGETLGKPIITLELFASEQDRGAEALWQDYGPALIAFARGEGQAEVGSP
ncbi:M14 family zinc carboxypeptidase [Botrimarina hoheduenensis]|uniref:Murein peptide amidase A n=1 Tax=Botrimarina hoheduenensis TaxID=2528000 RepID=A0A5C5WDB2_9BACT|nr:M14 family zinc carboxypeptidase [Botrimarina hoheduenensis]TWT48487.1 murein peptide amidase A [Botrimarina hoheduenensis]